MSKKMSYYAKFNVISGICDGSPSIDPILFIFANSAYPDVIPHNAAFYLGLHFLPSDAVACACHKQAFTGSIHTETLFLFFFF